MLKRFIVVITFLVVALFPVKSARADLFGGDVAVLAQILVNAIQQLYQLKQIFEAGKSSLDLMKDINRGINDSLSVIETIFPGLDPGIYRDWSSIDAALKKLQSIYGKVPNSPDAEVQRNADQSVAEAISLNNSIYDYTKRIDQIGEQIKSYSHVVSPGGAAKLTAEGIGVMLNVMNEGLRAQATSLKLQAQVVAQQNRKEKLMTEKFLSDGDALSSALNAQDTSFQVPRF